MTVPPCGNAQAPLSLELLQAINDGQRGGSSKNRSNAATWHLAFRHAIK
jgi:hypothetical protein